MQCARDLARRKAEEEALQDIVDSQISSLQGQKEQRQQNQRRVSVMLQRPGAEAGMRRASYTLQEEKVAVRAALKRGPPEIMPQVTCAYICVCVCVRACASECVYEYCVGHARAPPHVSIRLPTSQRILFILLDYNISRSSTVYKQQPCKRQGPARTSSSLIEAE
jgi:hypothetical protein